MKPAEIGQQLPNEFHGALLESLYVNYSKRSVEFRLKLYVSEDHRDEGHFRSGTFRVIGMAFFAIDVPDTHYEFLDQAEPELGGLLDTSTKICPSFSELHEDLGDEFFFHSFFVVQWNGFCHFAGKDATFQWNEP